jgi:hypothetical protein
LGQKKVDFSIFFSPEISFLKILEPIPRISFGLGAATPVERVGYGYGLGGGVDFNISNYFLLRTGFQYEVSKHRYAIEDGFGGSASGTPFEGTKNIATINTIGIPFSLGGRIKTNQESVNYLPSLGVLFNINLKNKSYGFNEINLAKLSGFFAWEIEQVLKNNLRFSLEPFFKYTPNKFIIFGNITNAKTKFEIGLNLRLKL